MTQFTDFGLAAPLLKALAAEGYTTPTPIQAQAIPGVMSGRDLLGIAQTGTGKTAAFALPILHRLAAERRQTQRKGARVVVVSPTRELATQIGESFRTSGRHMGVTVAVIFGGVKYGAQHKAMANGVDVLVA
ncbi:MAG: DEAD/DEAH box helicase, partial [Caulobacterales bacterium]